MKKYFFYSSTGSGIVSLQYPQAADSFGVVKNPIVYQIKLTSGAVLTGVNEGDLITETALIAAIVAAFSGAKVILERTNAKVLTALN